MPVIHNLTNEAFNLRIGGSIEANGSLEVTDAEAAVLEGHPLLSIEPDPAPPAPPAPAPVDPAPAPEPEPSPAPSPDVPSDVASAEAELAKAQADLAAAQAKENN